MDVAYNPGAWHDFGGAFVGAIAALLGLVFVVVSIHLRAVIDDPVLRRRAEIFRATHSPRGVRRDRLARFFIGELSAGLVFAGGLGLLVRALGGAYLVGAGVILGVLIAMLAIWTLFVGLGIEQRNVER